MQKANNLGITPSQSAPQGWRCPVCTAIHAPWVAQCSCEYRSDKYTGDKAHFLEIAGIILEQKVEDDEDLEETPEEVETHMTDFQKSINDLTRAVSNLFS